jgi:hypothetical protein
LLQCDRLARVSVRRVADFNLGIDRKLRGSDLVALKVRDVCHGDQVATRAVVMQHKTQRPVQFEVTPAARDAQQKWIKTAGLKSDDFLFPSRIHDSPHLGTRQYARILEGGVEQLGLDAAEYGTHPMRRKATLIRTWASRSTTPRKFPSRLKSEVVRGRPCGLPDIDRRLFDAGPDYRSRPEGNIASARWPAVGSALGVIANRSLVNR